ncbi:GNAT family N-acetyltransferase [Cellulomonas massiliensis]|uniref:GNAT family N-acetyltransferase n=1 Tax=Cellulomonas massiliensis TaxID=1465811 RepID=UPI0002D80AE5|nr:GNAT family N-acetyltransferase [Cellulomonas massiliensis]
MPDVGADARPAPYPAGWEADVVLQDGGTAHVRPIRPEDADALQAFHVAQSERSTYLRFFAPLERLPERDLRHLVTVDHVDRVALVAVTDGAEDDDVEHIIGVARYDRVDPETAEVAFNVSDAHQGRGIGSVLLEHLAAAARERGVRRFVAEVLPQNGRMIGVFRDAGFEVRQRTEDGVVQVAFDIHPTDRSLAVVADREHRAEARSMRALLTAERVLVVGPGEQEDTLDARMAAAALEHLRDGGADVRAVGLPGGVALAEVPAPVGLAVLALPPERAAAALRDLARLGVHGVVLLSAGYAEQGPEGLERQRALLRAAHARGMRVVGPASYGIVASRAGRVLNASLARRVPPPGRVGLFCQSAPVAVTFLEGVAERGLGLAELVSAGQRADVSGNDLMQYWAADDGTDVVGLYLESIGNPRKFGRVARRLAQLKPVVVATAGRSGQTAPPGHTVRATHAPARTLDEVMRRSGVIRVDSTTQLLDVVLLLAHQPVPTGRRAAVLASSAAVAAFVAEAATAAGLVVGPTVRVVAQDAPPEAVEEAVAAVYAAQDVDVVLVMHVPTVCPPSAALVAAVARHAATRGRTTAACVLGLRGVTEDLTADDPDGRPCTVPAYPTPEDAATALGHAARYAVWRAGDRGTPAHPADADPRAARRLVASWWSPEAGPLVLDPARTSELLGAVGVRVEPAWAVHDADEAVRAAAEAGWPVALKSTVPALRHRADLGGVRLDVGDEAELRADVEQVLALATSYPPVEGAPLEVQRMVERGVSCVLRTVEDPLFGPLVSFGLAGDASDLLGDVAYAVPPLTDVEVAELVRSTRASARLFGYRGLPAVDVGALEDVVARVALLADELPELRSLELNPVVVSGTGARVLSARATLAPADRADVTRRLAAS